MVRVAIAKKAAKTFWRCMVRDACGVETMFVAEKLLGRNGNGSMTCHGKRFSDMTGSLIFICEDVKTLTSN